MLDNLSRVSLGCFPTALYPLSRLRKLLGGPSLWIKRDDLTGLAFGGNKTRKLEFLIADALDHGADTVITTGSVQSNHARQTAAAAARMGLRCVLVLEQRAPSNLTGNLFLDHLLGAMIRWTGGRPRSEVMDEVAEEERAAGRTPYIIPYGGSNAIGATSYYVAMHEMLRQTREQGIEVNHIILASSSGGTQSGMVAGAAALHYPGKVWGMSVLETAEVLAPRVHDLAKLTATHLDLRIPVAADRVTVVDDYLGGGYGVLGEPEREAISLLAHYEGLLLDPVYTGKAMAALIDLIRKKTWRETETLLFWHTGGTPALFAYADELIER